MLTDWSAHVAACDAERCREVAAGVRTSAAVARLRLEMLRRWPDDVRARELAATLHVHQMTLAGTARTDA
jgi:hypothetical protein